MYLYTCIWKFSNWKECMGVTLRNWRCSTFPEGLGLLWLRIYTPSFIVLCKPQHLSWTYDNHVKLILKKERKATEVAFTVNQMTSVRLKWAVRWKMKVIRTRIELATPHLKRNVLPFGQSATVDQTSTYDRKCPVNDCLWQSWTAALAGLLASRTPVDSSPKSHESRLCLLLAQ